jgi:hypothetical protein
MRLLRLLLGLAFVALFVQLATAADLTQIERKIVKEPVYQSKPKYCLLVFGPEAKTKIWLVLDGDTLYVDRNGNGDLTEAGKKVAARKTNFPTDRLAVFDPGEVQDGKFVHKIILVERFIHSPRPDTKSDYWLGRRVLNNRPICWYDMGMEVEMPGWTGSRPGGRVLQQAGPSDVKGLLEFADRPQDAPILYFGGRWQIAPRTQQTLAIGHEEKLYFGIGTPGIGPGTTVWTGHDGVVPAGVEPKVEITYPRRSEKEPLIKQLYEIKERC